MARPTAQSAGFALPCRFLGLTEIEGSDTPGKCAICGERLVYVCHMEDANGVAFDAGCDCAKTTKLDDDGLRAMSHARKEAADMRAAERAEPGHKARVVAEAAARRAAYLRDVAARVEDLEAQESKLVQRIERGERGLVERADDKDLCELIAEQLPIDRETLSRTRLALATFRAKLTEG
jgi:hypothetical protein